jgi:hypothetical protein
MHRNHTLQSPTSARHLQKVHTCRQSRQINPISTHDRGNSQTNLSCIMERGEERQGIFFSALSGLINNPYIPFR